MKLFKRGHFKLPEPIATHLRGRHKGQNNLLAIATIMFLLLTAPVAAHRMGRAAYFNGVPLWEGTRYNDLQGKYDQKTHTLAGEEDSKFEGTLGDTPPIAP